MSENEVSEVILCSVSVVGGGGGVGGNQCTKFIALCLFPLMFMATVKYNASIRCENDLLVQDSILNKLSSDRQQ
jgi:hypothetical protein